MGRKETMMATLKTAQEGYPDTVQVLARYDFWGAQEAMKKILTRLNEMIFCLHGGKFDIQVPVLVAGITLNRKTNKANPPVYKVEDITIMIKPKRRSK